MHSQCYNTNALPPPFPSHLHFHFPSISSSSTTSHTLTYSHPSPHTTSIIHPLIQPPNHPINHPVTQSPSHPTTPPPIHLQTTPPQQIKRKVKNQKPSSPINQPPQIPIPSCRFIQPRIHFWENQARQISQTRPKTPETIRYAGWMKGKKHSVNIVMAECKHWYDSILVVVALRRYSHVSHQVVYEGLMIKIRDIQGLNHRD